MNPRSQSVNLLTPGLRVKIHEPLVSEWNFTNP